MNNWFHRHITVATLLIMIIGAAIGIFFAYTIGLDWPFGLLFAFIFGIGWAFGFANKNQ